MMRFIIRLSLDDTILFVHPNRLSLVAVLALAQASKEGSTQRMLSLTLSAKNSQAKTNWLKHHKVAAKKNGTSLNKRKLRNGMPTITNITCQISC